MPRELRQIQGSLRNEPRFLTALGAAVCSIALYACGSSSSDIAAVSDQDLTAGKQITYRARPRDSGVILIRQLGPMASCGRLAKVTIRSVHWDSRPKHETRDIRTVMSIPALSRIATGLFAEQAPLPTGEDIVIADEFGDPEVACLPGYQAPNTIIEQLLALDRL